LDYQAVKQEIYVETAGRFRLKIGLRRFSETYFSAEILFA